MTRDWTIATLLAVASAACGVESTVPPADLSPLTRTPAFAVITSDRMSTAVAMLDSDATLITEAWIDSGTTAAMLTATLDGDVVMPSAPIGTNVLTLLNQLGATVITRIQIPTGQVLSQFSAQRPEPDEGSPTRFRANIHDAIDLNDGTILVTRFQPNLREGAEDLDLGNDAVVVRLADGMILDRIDFSGVNTTEGSTLVYARPSGMVRVRDRIVVATTRLDELFYAGPGAVGVVDATARTVTAIPLPDLTDCLEVSGVPGDVSHAVVLCAGDTYVTMAERRAHAGLVTLVVDEANSVAVQHVWRAREHPDVPVPSNGLVSLGGSRVAVNAMGDRSAGTNDRYLVVDLATDEAEVAFSSEGAFVISKGAFVPERAQLLVPDAASGVHVFHVGVDYELTETALVDTSPFRRLPAREVRALSTE